VLYDTTHIDLLPHREDLTLVLVVASITPTLLEDLDRMGWTLSTPSRPKSASRASRRSSASPG